MADNITLNSGSGGATLATDDAGAGGHVQVVKLAVSTDGSATALTADNTNGLLADVKRVQGNVTVVGAAADGATLSGNPVLVAGSDGTNAQSISVTAGGLVQVHDGGGTLSVDDGASSLTVDAPVGTPVFVRLSDGAAAISALPVTDNGSTLSVDDGAGSLTVDGTVAATQSGTWNVTNVSGTVSLPTGASTAAKQPALGTAGTASSDVITVQGIASMTPLQVADNGGSLTVDNGGASTSAPNGGAGMKRITPFYNGGGGGGARFNSGQAGSGGDGGYGCGGGGGGAGTTGGRGGNGGPGLVVIVAW